MRFHWSDVRGADHCRTSQCFQRGESSGYPGIGRRLSPAPSGQALGPHSPASQSTVLSQLCPQPAFTLTQSSQLIPVDLPPLSSSPHALCPPSAAECSSVQEHDGNLPTGLLAFPVGVSGSVCWAVGEAWAHSALLPRPG